MVRLSFTLILAAAMLPASSVMAQHSQSPPRSDTYDRCMERAQANDPAMFECGGAELDRQDSRLNAVYRTLLAKLETDERAALVKAERDWIRYRDSHCDFEAPWNGIGTLDRIMHTDCTIRLTSERADQLTRLTPKDQPPNAR